METFFAEDQSGLYNSFFQACLDGDVELLNALSEGIEDPSAFDINVLSDEGETALSVAIRGGNHEVVEGLLVRGADVSLVSGEISDSEILDIISGYSSL